MSYWLFTFFVGQLIAMSHHHSCLLYKTASRKPPKQEPPKTLSYFPPGPYKINYCCIITCTSSINQNRNNWHEIWQYRQSKVCLADTENAYYGSSTWLRYGHKPIIKILCSLCQKHKKVNLLASGNTNWL